MSQPLTHVTSGEPFRPAAAEWNAFVDTARTVRDQRQLWSQPPLLPPGETPLYVVVESPWKTAGGDNPGTEIACCPLFASDTPNSPTVVSASVLTRDANDFPATASVQASEDARTLDVVKVRCGILQGRPYRGQIIAPLLVGGQLWLAGAINPSLFGVVKDIGSPQLVTLTNFQGDPLMPTTDADYAANMDLPVSDSLQLAEGVDYQVDDLVILTWIGAGYYVTWIQCQEVV